MKSRKSCGKSLRIILVLGGILLLAVGVPMLINEIYKADSGYVTLWNAADVLHYYGTLLGAAATITAVVCTIQFSKKQQDKERVLSVKPWFSSKTELLNSNDEICSLQNGNTIYANQYGDSWGSSKQAPFTVRKGIHRTNQEDCVIKYELTNVGGNSATSVTLYFEGKPLLPSFAIAEKSSILLVFSLPQKAEQIESKYQIIIRYGDIISRTKYQQKETLIVKKDERGLTFVQGQCDLLTAPETI